MQDRKFISAAICLLALTTANANAYAFVSAPYGWYVEANAGSTKVTRQSYPGTMNTSGIGGSASLGYKFMPYFAGEVSFTRYTDSTVKDQFGTTAGTIKRYTYALVARGIMPVYDCGFKLFAKLGIQRSRATVSINNVTAANNIGLSSSGRSSTGIYLGAGGQYYFMPELAVVGQWARAFGNNSTGTLDLYSIGIQFLFD